MKKQIWSILLVLCMVFTLLPFGVMADSSGTCGANAKWQLTGDTLTITGSGAMQDYTRSAEGSGLPMTYTADTPWYASRTQIKKVVVSNGITRIGNCAFYGVAMESISLPDSVTEIGDHALAAVTGKRDDPSRNALENLTLPKNLKKIDKYAFSGAGIRVLRFPATVESIGDFAISENQNLEVLIFEEGFKKIPPITIAATYNIIAVEIPASAKSVEFLPERLTDIYYRGTEAQWKSVSIPEDIAYRAEQATIHFGDPMAQFSDAPGKSNWAYEGIRFCVANGYMNGMEEGLFQPGGVTTRAQLVTILWRMCGSPAAKESAAFTDVQTHWAKDAVAWAAENDIVNGMGEGIFGPNLPITREQLVTIFYRYAKDYLKLETDALPETDAFSDAAQVSDWAQEAMDWAITIRLITGVGTADGPLLQPQGNATRAQIARIIMSFYESFPRLKYANQAA